MKFLHIAFGRASIASQLGSTFAQSLLELIWVFLNWVDRFQNSGDDWIWPTSFWRDSGNEEGSSSGRRYRGHGEHGNGWGSFISFHFLERGDIEHELELMMAMGSNSGN